MQAINNNLIAKGDKAKAPKRFCMDCGRKMEVIKKPTSQVVGVNERDSKFIYFIECSLRCPKIMKFGKHKDVNLLWCESLGMWVLKV
jgi:hypothetical protein